ncbi:prickle-like protein 4 [Manis javanica]|uniref:prickle-like protein 4 n=1 Tax=Manis javanica TaxID=9974 RepID=UPI003C6D3225
MSVLNSGWPRGGESHTPGEPRPPANSDSNPGPPPEEDPEDTAAQVDPEVLDVDTSQASKWPGLQSLLQQLPPQDRDVGVEIYSSCSHPRQASKLLATFCILLCHVGTGALLHFSCQLVSCQLLSVGGTRGRLEGSS